MRPKAFVANTKHKAMTEYPVFEMEKTLGGAITHFGL